MPPGIVHMAGMGLLTSVLAPLVILLTRQWPGWPRLTPPAVFVLPAFVVVHDAMTAAMVVREFPLALDLFCHAVLFLAAIAFWLPVLVDKKLSRAGRCLYLFLAAPALDMAGVFAVTVGDPAGGLAMIVAMLPMGLAAVALTWAWMREEEAGAPERPVSTVRSSSGLPASVFRYSRRL